MRPSQHLLTQSQALTMPNSPAGGITPRLAPLPFPNLGHPNPSTQTQAPNRPRGCNPAPAHHSHTLHNLPVCKVNHFSYPCILYILAVPTEPPSAPRTHPADRPPSLSQPTAYNNTQPLADRGHIEQQHPDGHHGGPRVGSGAWGQWNGPRQA